MSILDDLQALGVRASVDSLGIELRGARTVLTPTLVTSLMSRRSELHGALLERLSAGHTAPTPLAVQYRCPEPGCTGAAPSPTGRCVPCATRRVYQRGGLLETDAA